MTTPDSRSELAQAIREYLEEGWSCPPDAQRMLAEAARLLGEHQACGAPAPRLWALLRPDADELHDDKATALRMQAVMVQDCEDGYRLYEVREVSG